jgi:CheY-like chemotaxis protein
MSELKSILVIDDSPTDVFIIKKFLKRLLPEFNLESKSNGMEALEFFRAQVRKQSSDNPKFEYQLILLDINMPKMNGFEFMDQFEKEFAQDEFFKDAIFVVCSSSQNEADLKNAFERERINDFIVKPIELRKFEEVIQEYFP